jgi:hypothetical protein
MSENIDDFDENVGTVLALLYRNFPMRITIDESHVIPSEKAIGPEWLERYARRRAIYTSTMEWLIDAGYIWATDRDRTYGIYKECVLSVKGLEALNVVPGSLSESIGTKLGQAALAASSEGLKDLAKQALSAGAALLIGYVRAHSSFP